MRRELTPKEVLFEIDFEQESKNTKLKDIPQIATIYNKIKRAVSIKEDNFNLFIVDTFSNEKVGELISFIQDIYKDRESPKDICYVNYSDPLKPEPLFLSNGRGNEFREEMENIKNRYFDIAMEFYNVSSDFEKDVIVEEVNTKRNTYISELMGLAKNEGFDVKPTDGGFAFIPLQSKETMTEKEYDDLSEEKKDSIIKKVGILKGKAQLVLEKLKNIELDGINKVKKIYKEYLNLNIIDEKEELLLNFIEDDDVYEYIEKVLTLIENELVQIYSINIEDDQEEIKDILNKYNINVLVDNSLYNKPRVIYEEDPNLSNLIGNVEYENNNGTYSTDLSRIQPGSILLANEGCIILRLNQLVLNSPSYYYLKKILVTGKLQIDSSRNYLDILSIKGLKPKNIQVNVKVILIGDYNSYDFLYNADEEFKQLFPLRVEAIESVESYDILGKGIKQYILDRCKRYNSINISEEGIKEIAKYLSRLVDNKNKFCIKEEEIDKILVLTNNYILESGRSIINNDDIIKLVYEDEQIQEYYLDMYKENKILISLDGERVGVINGLAVIDVGYFKFGKPMRVTCVSCKGDGKIIDVQKESHLSGNIHEKSINIISGFISSIINPYEKVPVDFHLCFEQSYGTIDGDSASVSEVICILSSLSKVEIKQNIAVTGSINQFGEVQPIGGVNEKIEGFYKTCKLLKKVKDIGVLIPESNKNDLVLNSEVEEAIAIGDFHIYTMENITDAIEVMMNDDSDLVFTLIKEELKKYSSDC